VAADDGGDGARDDVAGTADGLDFDAEAVGVQHVEFPFDFEVLASIPGTHLLIARAEVQTLSDTFSFIFEHLQAPMVSRTYALLGRFSFENQPQVRERRPLAPRGAPWCTSVHQRWCTLVQSDAAHLRRESRAIGGRGEHAAMAARMPDRRASLARSLD